MMMIYITLLLLGMATCTICCDCQIQNWRWEQCNPKDKGTLNLKITASFTDNCERIHFNGTSENRLGKIHSVLIEVEGTVNGMPLISFSDPDGCSFKKPPPGGQQTLFLRDTIPIYCRNLTENFDIDLPLSEDEISNLESLSGDFTLKVWHKNLNNVVGQSDCYDISGTLHCSEDDN